MTALVLAILGAAFFLSLMAFAVALNIRPDIVRITGRFVCPAGTKMEVDVLHNQPDQPWARQIVVTCQRWGKTEWANAKALLSLWFLFFVASLPVAAVVVILASRWIPSSPS
jgi:P pilus assembly chaperone PapD